MPMQQTLLRMEADDSSRKEEDFDDAMFQDDSEDDFTDDSSSSDESSLGSAMDLEAERLWDALQTTNAAAATDVGQSQLPPSAAPAPSPSQILHAHVQRLATSTALKLEDDMVAHIRKEADTTDADADANAIIITLFESLLQAIRGSPSTPTLPRIKHVILGTQCLQLFSKEQHLQLYQCLADHHASTITYWKLGTTPTTTTATTSTENQSQADDEEDVSCGIPTMEFWKILTQHSWPSLTEFQIRGMELTTTTLQPVIATMVQFLESVAPTIQLFNLLGTKMMMTMTTRTTHSFAPQTPSSTGDALLDPLFQAVGQIPKLDEVQIQMILVPISQSSSSSSPSSSSSVRLISVETLDRLLQVKPKWWRLTLDGLGLTDAHVHVLTQHLQASEACKMNDLLSLRQNPHITPACLHRFYHNVCLHKARMGLVLSDDISLNALVDFVRPLNNLHRRLEYKDKQGQYSNVDQWMEWMTSLSRLPWIDEARKINYIWFTLMEQPSMIDKAIQVCSSTNGSTSTASLSEMVTEASLASRTKTTNASCVP